METLLKRITFDLGRFVPDANIPPEYGGGMTMWQPMEETCVEFDVDGDRLTVVVRLPSGTLASRFYEPVQRVAVRTLEASAEVVGPFLDLHLEGTQKG